MAQNGFIDAIVLLSANVNLVKETFLLYGGRASMKDLISIGKKVYYSIAISGSEVLETGIEEVSSEIIEKFGSDVMKGVPLLGKVMGSVADGILSAFLLCRVGLITENYCTKTYIKSEKELFPGYKSLSNVVIPIIEPIKNEIIKNLIMVPKEKVVNIAKTIIDSIKKFGDSTSIYVKDNIEKNTNKIGKNFKKKIQKAASLIIKKRTNKKSIGF